MKTYILTAALLLTGLIYAQETKPVLEPFGNKVKATYFYDNGQVQQEGFFENGKLEGYWVAYNEDGTKKSSGFYKEGAKVGKWFFWKEANLSEVDYASNTIATIKNWKREAVAVKN
ncbi:toxin-antitoxin system YwqK family antitoxin [Flavobacterium sp. TSSA_36]|jgi:antitoxin component YwqK of YwqJK toxin-antitoxin module|uniref:toxin-antitoxin system YwqK family antitoxin n=1 Tax=Flavobacterium sp. TSSA_36 TaxID=3447669 RepID=UPI003F2A47DC